MKRVWEKILVWLGLLLQFELIFIYGVIAPFMNDDSFKSEIKDSIKEEASSGKLSNADINSIVSHLNEWIIYLIGLAIIVASVALITALIINKLPKTAGVIFILLAIAAVLSLNFLATLFWLIAGIMLIVRRNKQTKRKASA